MIQKERVIDDLNLIKLQFMHVWNTTAKTFWYAFENEICEGKIGPVWEWVPVGKKKV
jgi:hypothetical protein